MDESNQLKRMLNICDEALSKETGDRSVFLDDACKDNTQLRRAVDSVLMSIDNAESFLEDEDVIQAASLIGDRVGDYVLTKELGVGGMGSVYLAERVTEDFDQFVAVKMIRRNMMTNELISRFDSERKLLATLNHPYIAQLIDGGTSSSGMPYLVMEYIDGVRIDEYCDQHKLDLDARIQLIRKVASAVTSAHQNLIIHRDLKPSNVLVTEDGIPKLLDFGIAKLLDKPSDSGAGHTTVFGHQPMTPDYSSPEQILHGKVTTTSDVYSLGVLAYQILTGALPYHIEFENYSELVESVDSMRILKPSALETLNESGNTLDRIASLRSTTPVKLSKRLSGDLDNILLKALQKNPDRRYASVADLSKDLDRFMRNLPVSARSDSWRYRFGRFVSRHKMGVAAATVALLSIVSGAGVSIWQAQQAKQQLVRAESVSRYLRDILLSPSANWDATIRMGRDATISDVLLAAEKQLDNDLLDHPNVRMELYRNISEAFARLKMSTDGVRTAQKLVALVEREAPNDLKTLGEAYHMLANATAWDKQYEKAYGLFDKALEVAEQDNSNPTIIKLYILNDYAVDLSDRGHFAKALPLQDRAVRESFELFGPELRAIHAIGYANLGRLQLDMGLVEQAEFSKSRGFEAHNLFTEQTQLVAAHLHLLEAHLATTRNQLSAARDSLVEAERYFTASHGPGNTESFSALSHASLLLTMQGKYDEAQLELSEIKEKHTQQIESPGSWYYTLAKAHLELSQGNVTKALELADRAEKLHEDSTIVRLGYIEISRLRANAYREKGDFQAATNAQKHSLDLAQKWLGSDNDYVRRISVPR